MRELALSNIIQNYGDLPKRRLATTMGLEYKTPWKTIKPKFQNWVQLVIAEIGPRVWTAVRLHPFADSSTEFEFVLLCSRCRLSVLYLIYKQG